LIASHDLLAFLARKGTSATHARNINLIVNTSSAENVMNCTCLHQSWSYKNETMNGISMKIHRHRRHSFIENSTWASLDTFLLELWIDYM
jgi:hypothetical protein